MNTDIPPPSEQPVLPTSELFRVEDQQAIAGLPQPFDANEAMFGHDHRADRSFLEVEELASDARLFHWIRGITRHNEIIHA